MPLPKWSQVREFCRRQGYIETSTDHSHYLKVQPDRSTSRTIVSFGIDGEEVPSQMRNKIWKWQLRLASESEFWRGLQGDPVRYAITPLPDAPRPLPAFLQRFLRDTIRLPDSEIEKITREQTQDLLNRHYAKELQDH